MKTEMIVKKNTEFNNNGALLKRLRQLVKYEGCYRFNVHMYTSADRDGDTERVTTDLEVTTRIIGECGDDCTTYWLHCIESTIDSNDVDLFWDTVEAQRNALKGKCNQLFQYLVNNIDSVERGGDVVQ